MHKIENLKDYLRFIGKKPEELDELYRDLLIHVTGFFREPETFLALRKHRAYLETVRGPQAG